MQRPRGQASVLTTEPGTVAGEKKAKKENREAGLVGETKRDIPCMGCLQHTLYPKSNKDALNKLGAFLSVGSSVTMQVPHPVKSAVPLSALPSTLTSLCLELSL